MLNYFQHTEKNVCDYKVNSIEKFVRWMTDLNKQDWILKENKIPIYLPTDETYLNIFRDH